MKKHLYILTNISLPGICKVGITDNIERRIKDLSNTSLPTKYQLYESFSHPDISDPEIMEQEIFNFFSDKRLNSRREFVSAHPEAIIDFVKANKNIKKDNVVLDKNSKTKLEMLGLKKGDKLNFLFDGKEYEEIFSMYDSRNNIVYNGNIYSLSNVAQKILKEKFNKDWKAVQGTLYWAFNGKSIRELLNEKGIR